MNIARVDLGTTLVSDSLAPLLETMREAVRDGDAVEVEAAAVEQLDTAGMQALVVFAAALEAKGSALWWLDRSDELTDSARVLGLARALGLDQ